MTSTCGIQAGVTLEDITLQKIQINAASHNLGGGNNNNITIINMT